MQVLFEDNHIIAINKKAGEIVQGDKTGDEPLSEKVKSFLKKKYDKPGNVFLGTVHRLDRPVSGVIVFAKTSKALSRMNKLFQTKEVQKTYWALSDRPPHPKEGTLIHFLTKDSARNKAKAHSKEVKHSKKSELSYQYLKAMGSQHLIAVLPKTGRPHQIRVQLASIGCIIKGDVKYGAMFPNKDKSICLHARKIEFTHPVSKEKVSISADLNNNSIWK